MKRKVCFNCSHETEARKLTFTLDVQHSPGSSNPLAGPVSSLVSDDKTWRACPSCDPHDRPTKRAKQVPPAGDRCISLH